MSEARPLELTEENAAAYLASRGVRAERVSPLGGGVSNTVLLVESGRDRFVLKQALGKLRVEEEWLSDRTRVLRECAAIEHLAPHLPEGAVPRVLWVDEPNLLFAMSAASRGAPTWKDRLLRGEIDERVAARVGETLAAMVRSSWKDAACAVRFGDLKVFEQLRLDPYYRFTGSRHPELREAFEERIAAYSFHCVALVHGDWSPKNFLLDGSRVMAIDFEVIHFGDPAFDSAFVLNHLLLKSFHRPGSAAGYARLAGRLWTEYIAGLPERHADIEQATLRHLGCLLLARIDGKSPAEYLRDPRVRQQVRDFAAALIRDPGESIREVFSRRL